MLLTVVAPELLLAKNMGDILDADDYLSDIKRYADDDGVPWTMTHSLFANMGGFAIRSYARNRMEKEKAADQQVQSNTPLMSDTNQKRTHSNGVNPNPYHLVASDILILRKFGVMPKLPYFSKEELNDKSKSDAFVRTIAVGQILWMAIQIIYRAVRHLAISQLEIAAVAFSACAVIIYIVNWEKPKGVQVPLTILHYPEAIPPTVSDIIGRHPIGLDSSLVQWFISLFGVFEHQNFPGYNIPNDLNLRKGRSSLLGVAIGFVIFGAIHLTAWNFLFPTRAEQIVWWAASLYCTTFVVWVAVLLFCIVLDNPLDIFFYLLIILLTILYVLARLFLLVEVFRTLYFLPPDAYVTTWAADIPHLS